MNLPLYIARRIAGTNDDGQKVSKPAIRIATFGVAIGLAVMIITVSVILGFKHTVRNKIAGFGSHIQVENIMSVTTGMPHPACIDDSMLCVLNSIEGVTHASRYALTQGILKTDTDFFGVMLKGIGPEYDLSFLRECLVEGELPQFSDTTTHYPIMVSQTMASKLNLNIGDRLYAYFVNENGGRTRRFNVCAIYQTNMKRFDDLFCITDLYVVNKLNGWFKDQCSGAELQVADFGTVNQTHLNVIRKVNRTTDRYNNVLASRTITELYPQVFSWLELLDLNVWIILGLMVALAGFTMISGLLIIILERTQMIGVLKALGAQNTTIRHTFLWTSVFIIGKGLLWGNVIGIGLVLLQILTGVIKLDAQTYYVSEAPMELHIPLVILLNIATLVISVLMLIGPSYLISRIHPARSMNYE